MLEGCLRKQLSRPPGQREVETPQAFRGARHFLPLVSRSPWLDGEASQALFPADPQRALPSRHHPIERKDLAVPGSGHVRPGSRHRIVFAERVREQHQHALPVGNRRQHRLVRGCPVALDPRAVDEFRQARVGGSPGCAAGGEVYAAAQLVVAREEAVLGDEGDAVAVQNAHPGHRAVPRPDLAVRSDRQRSGKRLRETIRGRPIAPHPFIVAASAPGKKRRQEQDAQPHHGLCNPPPGPAVRRALVTDTRNPPAVLSAYAGFFVRYYFSTLLHPSYQVNRHRHTPRSSLGVTGMSAV